MKTPNTNDLTWKQFVVTCCRLGVANTSGEIAEAISRNDGITVSKGQVAAVKANYTMGKYN